VSLAAVGLALASALGAWFELAALRRRLPRSSGVEAAALVPWRTALGPLGTASLSAAAAGLLWWAVLGLGVLAQAAVVLPAYGALYLGLSWRRLRSELLPPSRRRRAGAGAP
jgi:hypothetical protein